MQFSLSSQCPERLSVECIPFNWTTDEKCLGYIHPESTRQKIAKNELLADDVPLEVDMLSVAQDGIASLELFEYLCTHQEPNKEQQRQVKAALPFVLEVLGQHAIGNSELQSRIIKVCRDKLSHIKRYRKIFAAAQGLPEPLASVLRERIDAIKI